jgi:hypothetical protein
LIINTARVDTFVAALPALLDAVQPASRTSPPADKEASP